MVRSVRGCRVDHGPCPCRASGAFKVDRFLIGVEGRLASRRGPGRVGLIAGEVAAGGRGRARTRSVRRGLEARDGGRGVVERVGCRSGFGRPRRDPAPRFGSKLGLRRARRVPIGSGHRDRFRLIPAPLVVLSGSSGLIGFDRSAPPSAVDFGVSAARVLIAGVGSAGLDGGRCGLGTSCRGLADRGSARADLLRFGSRSARRGSGSAVASRLRPAASCADLGARIGDWLVGSVTVVVGRWPTAAVFGPQGRRGCRWGWRRGSVRLATGAGCGIERSVGVGGLLRARGNGSPWGVLGARCC